MGTAQHRSETLEILMRAINQLEARIVELKQTVNAYSVAEGGEPIYWEAESEFTHRTREQPEIDPWLDEGSALVADSQD